MRFLSSRCWLSLLVLMFCTQNLATAEPTLNSSSQWWPGAQPYTAEPRPTDGQNMALTMQKITGKQKLNRPLLIWALGSSYTNFQGDGSELIGLIRNRYPDAPQIKYKKQVGGGTSYQFLDGWVRHLVVADQPDVVILYAVGKAADLEDTIRDIQASTTADIIVPTIHWRKQRASLWGKTELPPDQEVDVMREVCKKYGVEFVENRAEMTEYMQANQLKPEDMTFDSVHQNSFTRKMNSMNFARHFNVPGKFAYAPQTRERRIEAEHTSQVLTHGFSTIGGIITTTQKGATAELSFEGKRIDLQGIPQPNGGTVEVFVDGIPAGELPVFNLTFVQPDKKNSNRGDNSIAPHGVLLGKNIIPQQWTLAIINKDGKGDYELVGSVTGKDGQGNADNLFVSNSGQIKIEPGDWRQPKLTKVGDCYRFEVIRAAHSQISFSAKEQQPLQRRIVMNLPDGKHTLKLVAVGDGPVTIDAFEVFQPPLAVARPE